MQSRKDKAALAGAIVKQRKFIPPRVDLFDGLLIPKTCDPLANFGIPLIGGNSTSRQYPFRVRLSNRD